MKKKRRKSKARIVAPLVLVVIAAGLFFGRNAIVDGIKGKAAETVAKEIIKQQITKAVEQQTETTGGTGESTVEKAAADAAEIVENMEPEDVQTATDIAEKVLDSGDITQYVEMAKDGEISQLKEQLQSELTAEEQQQLMELYEKYKP